MKTKPLFALLALTISPLAFASDWTIICSNKNKAGVTAIVNLNGGGGTLQLKNGQKEQKTVQMIGIAQQTSQFVTAYDLPELNAVTGISIDLDEGDSQSGWMAIKPDSAPFSGYYNCRRRW